MVGDNAQMLHFKLVLFMKSDMEKVRPPVL